jgi:hypothetical protein
MNRDSDRDRERFGDRDRDRDRQFGNRYINRDDRRGGGGGRGYTNPYFGKSDDYRSGYNRPNYNNRDGPRNYQRGPPRPYYPPRDNFYDNRNEKYEDDYEIQEEKEKAESEKEFEKKYTYFIDKIDGAFDGMASKKEIGNIIKALIKMPSLTIFEAMNLIYRSIHIYNAINYYNSKMDKTGAKLGSVDGDIFENKYHGEFTCEKLNEQIEKYKTEQKGEKLDNSYDLYQDENFDKRRKLTKNIEGIYNYLPIKIDSIQMNEDDKKKLEDFDIFAKNENEINYHPLFFKTLMCHSCVKDENELLNTDCPYCHDIQNDFRIIYDYKDNKICLLMNDLVNSELFTFVDYLEYIPKNIRIKDFNLKTFKVHKCQLDTDGKCPNDYHLCPYYHESNKDERRRPLWLFRYSSEMCEECFDKKKKKYIAKNCPLGDFCNNVHNKNEYNYHINNFRQIYPCTRNPEGKCPFFITCYGIHKGENEGNDSIDEEEGENDDSINEENLENEDDDIKEVKDKISKSIIVGKNFRCRKCNELKPILNYFVDCKHFLCQNCFKKLTFDLKKSKKEHKKEEKKDDNDILKCPFCDKELVKGKILRCKFS